MTRGTYPAVNFSLSSADKLGVNLLNMTTVTYPCGYMIQCQLENVVATSVMVYGDALTNCLVKAIIGMQLNYKYEI